MNYMKTSYQLWIAYPKAEYTSSRYSNIKINS